MFMMKASFFLSILLLLWTLCSAAAPTAPEAKAQREQNTPPNMVDQIDSTDVFAIPVNPSEQEEELTNKKLEQMQKKPVQKLL